jgi:rhamnogalacturonyl hydrolase YesR
VGVEVPHGTPDESFKGLPLVYHTDFDEPEPEQWKPHDPAQWKFTTDGEHTVYSQFKRESTWKPEHRTAFNVSVLQDYYVSDFVLDIWLKSTMKDYAHRDMVIVFGYQDETRHHYAHLGLKADAASNTINITYDAPRKPMQKTRNDGTPWDDQYHHARIVRKVSTGAIEVYFDDMETPVMTAVDQRLIWGLVGVGSFDDKGNVDRVVLYGHRVTPPIVDATAKSHAEGYEPSNTIDHNTETRWSAQGEGQWIQYKLAQPAPINAAAISWLKGNQRTSQFDIAASSDGETFQQVFSGESHKKSDWLEVYPFDEVEAQYVRIIGHGNSENDWNSITEARVGRVAEIERIKHPTLDIDSVSDEVFERDKIVDIMQRVNAYMYAHPWRPDDRDWVRGTYYTGVMGLYRATEDPGILEQAMNWAKKHEFQAGDPGSPPNRLTCGQTWCELYFIKKDPKMIEPLIEWINSDHPLSPKAGEVWYKEGGVRYADSLYVAPPTLMMLTEATGDEKYREMAHEMFWDVTDLLFDDEAGLYYRDKRFIGQRTDAGKKIFWSRGNGWVIAGIARILQHLPKDDPHYDRYVDKLQTMAASLAKAQGHDGLWRANLADPDQYTNPESSGTAFFTYAMAWGINNGKLDREKYLPVVRKAWKGLCAAVNADGRLGWVQPIGADPRAASPDQTHEYAVGLFLLAGSEMVKLGPDRQ